MPVGRDDQCFIKQYSHVKSSYMMLLLFICGSPLSQVIRVTTGGSAAEGDVSASASFTKSVGSDALPPQPSMRPREGGTYNGTQ